MRNTRANGRDSESSVQPHDPYAERLFLERIRPASQSHEGLADTAVRLAGERAFLHYGLDSVDSCQRNGAERQRSARYEAVKR